ncbi:hypothetical protein JCGZ_04405 [Jatropha curcas]|uniref:Uncharacterized protein n=1 Tax=Jatropha curcas TaxID=180498 RepID=A0A067L1W6_JATCU|nr:hypothetical protein JCGZ_04405 [Jatropha curcas]
MIFSLRKLLFSCIADFEFLNFGRYFGYRVDVVHFLQWIAKCDRVLQECEYGEHRGGGDGEEGEIYLLGASMLEMVR